MARVGVGNPGPFVNVLVRRVEVLLLRVVVEVIGKRVHQTLGESPLDSHLESLVALVDTRRIRPRDRGILWIWGEQGALTDTFC